MSTFDFTRSIPVDTPYDAVVAGSGPAGTAATVSAARLGMKTLVIEGTGCAGGMGTSGLVTAFDPMANGERCQVEGEPLGRRSVCEYGYSGTRVNPCSTCREHDGAGRRYRRSTGG